MELDSCIDVTSIFKLQALNSSLSQVFVLNYKLQKKIQLLLSNKEPKS